MFSSIETKLAWNIHVEALIPSPWVAIDVTVLTGLLSPSFIPLRLVCG